MLRGLLFSHNLLAPLLYISNNITIETKKKKDDNKRRTKMDKTQSLKEQTQMVDLLLYSTFPMKSVSRYNRIISIL